MASARRSRMRALGCSTPSASGSATHSATNTAPWAATPSTTSATRCRTRRCAWPRRLTLCFSAQWAARSGTTPRAKTRPEDGLLAIRKGLDLFANLRPVQVVPQLIDASPLKPSVLEGVDFIVVRELTGGLYYGKPKKRWSNSRGRRGVDTMYYTEEFISRVLRVGFELARMRRKKLTSVDKANVLESSRLWREIAMEMGEEYPDIELDHVLVDTAAMQLVRTPSRFDVMVAEKHLRRHPHGRGRGAIRLDGHAALSEPGRGAGTGQARLRTLRAHPRDCAGHRGQGHREPHREHPEHGDAAALLAGDGRGGGRSSRTRSAAPSRTATARGTSRRQATTSSARRRWATSSCRCWGRAAPPTSAEWGLYTCVQKITGEANNMSGYSGVVELGTAKAISIMLKYSKQSDRCQCGHYLREHANALLEIYDENVNCSFRNIGPCKHDSRDIFLNVGGFGFSIGKKVCACSGYTMTKRVRHRIDREVKRVDTGI